jgi:hypothetical protein
MTHIGEAEQFELRRSSCAEISQAIAAVDDDWTCPIEQRGRIAKDAADGKVNRTADVGGLVLVRGQRIDDLHCAGGEHRGEFTMLDFSHCYERIAARVSRAVCTIVSPLPEATRAVSTS